MNIVKKQKYFYIMQIIGAVVLVFIAVLGGKNLREKMIVDAAASMGQRVADLYYAREEDRMENVSAQLIQADRELESFPFPDSRFDLAQWMSIQESGISTNSSYSNVHMFIWQKNVLYDENSPKGRYCTKDELSFLASADGSGNVLSEVKDNEKDEKMLTVFYMNPITERVVGYSASGLSAHPLSVDPDMLKGSAFLLFDDSWSSISCVVSDGNTAAKYLDMEDQSETLSSIFLDTDFKIVKQDGRRFYMYSSLLRNGWHAVLVFPEDALTASMKSSRDTYYQLLGVVLLLILFAAFYIHKKRNLHLENRILVALSSSYKVSYYVDFRKETFTQIQGSGSDRLQVHNSNQIMDLWNNVLSVQAKEEYHEQLNAMFWLPTLQERLKKTTSLSMEFEHKQFGWCRLSCIPVEVDRNGLTWGALFALYVIDEEKKEMLTLSKEKDELIETLKSTAYMFDRFFIVNLIKGTYVFAYSRSENAMDDEWDWNRPYSEEEDCRFFEPIEFHSVGRYFSTQGIREALMDKEDLYFEYCDKAFPEVYLGASVHCIERENGIPVKVVYAVRDISEIQKIEESYKKDLKDSYEQLRDQAIHDPLTHVYNRRGFEEILLSSTINFEQCALINIDVDTFKSVNDTYGHPMGDALLIKTAGLLKKTFRSSDIVVRTGGDEFMVILVDATFEHLDAIKKKIHAINEEMQKEESDIPASSISAGIAFSRKGEGRVLYTRADKALYYVKKNGRNGVGVFEELFPDE